MTSADAIWLDNLKRLLKTGHVVERRGTTTKEFIGFQSSIFQSSPLITEKTRKLGYKFAPAEAHWILSGDNRVSTINPFAPGISRFSSNGLFFDGAYGPMVVDQLGHILEAFRKDLYTRQAIISIWRPNLRDSKDYPCTLSLQFLVQHVHGKDYMNCIASMRSSDIWLGWPYDMFNFTCIAYYLMIAAGIHRSVFPGKTVINAGSQHIYKSEWERAEKLIDRPQVAMFMPSFEPTCYENTEDFMADLIAFRDKKLCVNPYFNAMLDWESR